MDRVRQVQMLQLTLAKEVKRICEKHDIKYFIMAGTLLGAVRHGGFIPWDDDLDIGMERGEYEKFLAVADSELGDEFHLQTWDREEHYAYPFGKLMLKGTTWLEAVARKVNITHGVYIDLFPFDPIPNEEKDRARQNRKHIFYRQLLLAINRYDAFTYRKGFKRAVFAGITLFRGLFSNKTIKRKYDDLIKNGGDLNSTDMYSFGTPYNYKKGQMKREWVENLKPIKFEDTMFLAPEAVDDYLTYLYGDYMTPPPEDKRGNYHGIIESDFGKYSGNGTH